MRFAFALLLSIAVVVPARADHVEVGRGHITTGNVVADTRSVTVLGEALDREALPDLQTQGIDGFFLQAPEPGTVVRTITIDRSGLGFALNINFHTSERNFDGTRVWIPRSCSPGWFIGAGRPRLEVTGCVVPAGAATLEVSADWGADLDVVVVVQH